MKKILAIILVVALCACFFQSVTADEPALDVSIKNITDDVITVSGSASLDEIVTVYVLNPGKTLSNVSGGQDVSDGEVYQFFGTTLSKAGKFSIDVKIVPYGDSSGGEYKIFAICGGEVLSTDYLFYSYSKKSEFVEVLRDETDPAVLKDTLPEICEVFGLKTLPLYVNEDVFTYAKYICSISDQYSLENPEDVSVLLYDALVLSAFNSGNDKLFGDDNVFAFWSQLSDETDEIYDDYLNVNEIGKEKIKNALLSGEYESLGEVYKKFRELTLLYGITENSLGGSGYVSDFFSNYEDDYKDAGFNFTKFNNYSNKKTIYALMAKSSATSLDELADEFNDALVSKNNTPSSGGGGGGASSGGGGFSGGSTGNAVGSTGSAATVEDYLTGTNEKTNPTITYVDVKDDKWYYEPIMKLTAYNIISGYPGGRFEPMKNVTRAEILKMFSIAFPIETEGEGVAFADVSPSSWYAPFIEKASSLGIFLGSDGFAKPDKNVTREDAAVLLYRILKIKNVDLNENKDFTDDDQMAEYSKEAISKLAGFGILNGNGTGNYLPKNSITRAEASQMIYSALTKTGGVEN